MANLKYKLVKTGLFPYFYDALVWNGEHISLYRIKAVRDIPEHGVKKGDLGGYVSSSMILSQYDSCWIGGEAKALGNVFIAGDAFIGDSALVVCNEDNRFIDIAGNTKILNLAVVSINASMSDVHGANTSTIIGDVLIEGKTRVSNVGFIDGKISIRDEASIHGAKQITGQVTINRNADIEENTTIAGNTYISDNSIVEYGATVTDCTLMNNAQVYPEETVTGKSLGGHPKFLEEAGKRFEKGLILEDSPSSFEYNKNLLFDIELELRLLDDPDRNNMDFDDIIRFLNEVAAKNGSRAKIHGYDVKPETTPSVLSSDPPEFPPTAVATFGQDVETVDALNLLAEIKAELNAYESDIVKIISYPAMTDRTNPFTLEMVQALKLANRLALNPSHKGFVASVFDLEKKFIAAEANALKIASTQLSDTDRKKTEKAKDLLAMAADEASSENEKELAFTQGFKQLEGIIFVPEVAVDTFRVKIGLKELEYQVKERV